MNALPTDLDQALIVADWMLKDWLGRHPSFLMKGAIKDWDQNHWATAATEELNRRDGGRGEDEDDTPTSLLERFPNALLFAIMENTVDMTVVFETSSKTLIDLRNELQRRAPGRD